MWGVVEPNHGRCEVYAEVVEFCSGLWVGVACGNGGGPSDDNARGAGRSAAPAVSAAAKFVFRVAAGVPVWGCSALREGDEYEWQLHLALSSERKLNHPAPIQCRHFRSVPYLSPQSSKFGALEMLLNNGFPFCECSL